MTEIDMTEYSVLVNGVNGFCDERMNGNKGCGDCPCDGNDRCLLSSIKELLQEHLKG